MWKLFFSGGKSHRISPFRRLVADLMHFSTHVPSVTIERRMNLTELIAARQAADPKPTWSALFTKAYAIVAARMPALRMSYVKFPWPRLYEHPANVATLNIEREIGSERIVLYGHVVSPEKMSLDELDKLIRFYKEAPVAGIPAYRNACRMARIPWPLRRLVWWCGLNIFGGLRSHHYGTFGLTTVAAEGAGVLNIIPILTSTLHYGLFDGDGAIDMRLAFDHRVFDGVTGAKALVAMEQVLLADILDEVHERRAGLSAA